MAGRRLLLVVTVVALFGALTPASASEPHIVDPCGPLLGTREAVLPEHDVCSGTFSTLSDPEKEEPVRLEARLRVAGQLDDRAPSGYYVAWVAGGCQMLFLHEDENPEFPERRELLVDCPGASRRTLQPPADVFSVTLSGRDVTLEFTFTGVLAQFAAAHSYGVELTGLFAGAALRAGPYGVGFYGWDDNLGTFSVLYDHAEGSRPFVVGS